MKEAILVIIFGLILLIIVLFIYCSLIVASQYDRRYNEISKNLGLHKRRNKKK